MKELWKDILVALFLGVVLPGIMLNLAVNAHRQQIMPKKMEMNPYLKTQVQPVSVYLRDGSNIRQTELEQYIVGVVLAEMPASFEAEALKAQAVAARTYTAKAAVTGGKHGDGSVCIQPGCCQAYLTEEAYLDKGGTPEGLQKVRSAVTATSGQVVVYGGELIEATYFSCSGGNTEDAAAVWGTEVPYLQARPSPGEERAVHYMDTVSFSPEAFCIALGRELSGSPETWFGQVTFTSGGGVAEICIGEENYTGTRIRSLLNLRSTSFYIRASEQEIVITTKGYGHRVGMSQYGADAMAVGGSSYEEILAWYYPGTELAQLQS